jgi:hypothetical protein
MMAIYHVTSGWDGGDLLSLAERADRGELTLDEALDLVAGKWFGGDLRDAEEYLDDDGREVHCHATLAEAIEYRDEWCPGGEVLAIDDADLDVRVGREYPHPVVRDAIPADCIVRALAEVA